MILLKYRNAIFFSLSIFALIGLYSSKGGRGGGGARSGGSRFGTSFRSSSNTRNSAGSRGTGVGSSYRSSGVRWSSFGAGMVAYGVMSSLARRGPYGHSGYHSNYGYSGHQPRGSTCTNNEDFGNGTVFGTFVCPLPEFDPSAIYCCGEDEYEYCCKFFDSNSRKIPVILAILAAFGLIIGIIVCIQRVYSRRHSDKEIIIYFIIILQEEYVQPPMNMTNVNRNFNQPRPPFGNNMPPYGGYQPRPMFPGSGNQPRPPYPGYQARPPFPGNQPNSQYPGNQPSYNGGIIPPIKPENAPLLQNGSNNGLPYPTEQSAMPQPNFDQPPPNYSDLKN